MKKNKIIVSIAAAMTAALLVAGSDYYLTSASAKKNIGVEKAKEIALKDAKLKGKKVTFVKTKLDKDDGKTIYDIEFYVGNKEYDYEIDAKTGKILERDMDIENYKIPDKKVTDKKDTNDKMIGLKKAKEIALKDAKLKGKKVVFVKAKLDKDDGKHVYDIEFYYDNKEYDYEIEAFSGKVLEEDFDIESFDLSAEMAKDGISKEEAESIVLKHIGIKESDIEVVKIKQEYEDGKAIYEIKLITVDYEYEYEVDMETGDILNYDQDALDDDD